MDNILRTLSLREKIELCVDAADLCSLAIPEKGVPELVMADGTSGIRLPNKPKHDPRKVVFVNSIRTALDTPEVMEKTYPATCFPSGSSIACSFDPDLAQQIGEALAEECKSRGIGLLFAPALNTRRIPLDGRAFEYFSEDPCLAGEMAGGYVKGLQDHGVAACVKHFACNNSNYMRTKYDSIVEERALREIYLNAFERVIKKARPQMVMGAYNSVNGEQACESHRLLTQILRNEWGFDGVVISDFGAVKDYIKAFRAGVDYVMPHSKMAIDQILQAVQTGRITEDEVDAHCQRVLELVMKYTRQGKPLEHVDYKKHHELAQKAALDCAVLLKNEDQILPLSKTGSGRIAILGNLAETPIVQGAGCARVRETFLDIPLEEIRQAVRGTEIEIDYARGYLDTEQFDAGELEKAVNAAQNADVAIVFAGIRSVVETDDYNRRDIKLPAAQEQLIRKVSACNRNTIVVLMNGDVVEMSWSSQVKAVLDMWYSGQGCGNAVAKLLFGDANPSGKLPVTIPKKLSDAPGYLHFPGENDKHIYEEGIFVGYRYYDKKEVDPLFEFGHGLSYSQFVLSDLELENTEITLPETVKVSLMVTNIGDVAGAEVVQLYVSDDHARLKRPVRELKKFQKVFLQPGETKKIDFLLESRDFAYYDPKFQDWIVDTGVFRVEIGTSVKNILLRDELSVVEPKKHYASIEPDTHYIELFQNEEVQQCFFECLIEFGLLTEADITPKVRHDFIVSFWGITQHLETAAPYLIEEAQIVELLNRLNHVVDRQKTRDNALPMNCEKEECNENIR